MSLDPELLFRALLSAGIKGIAGVPCSILNHLILEAEASSDVDYVAASVEGEAVSAAAGMWLAGGLGVLLHRRVLEEGLHGRTRGLARGLVWAAWPSRRALPLSRWGGTRRRCPSSWQECPACIVHG